MPDPLILVLGRHDDWDVTAMKAAFDPLFLAGTADLAHLDADVRARVRAVAFRGAALGAAEMDLLPSLEMIANYGAGTDHIDLVAAGARGIQVTNTPDVLTDDVSDLAVGMMLALNRNIVANADWTARGDWVRIGAPPLARRLSGTRAGIVGLGRIGQAIGHRLAAFGMDIAYHSRSEKKVPDGWKFHARPETLAAASDWLIVALVGGKATQRYISAAVIGAMGKDAVLVNIARGSVVDEPALLDALEQRRIRGAALDVFEDEPGINKRFLELDNVILQPHQGSATVETRKAMGALQRANIDAWRAHTPVPSPVEQAASRDS